jgi:tRNA modification GTPase
MPDSDTICAVATPPGIGGIGIVRLSGPGVPAMAEGLLGALPRPRAAVFSPFLGSEGETLDTGIALYFPAPHSFTGEHVLELQGHGGPVVLKLLTQRALELGARIARPGEFSERAFLNDKIDLVQAEAIADLIESGTEAAARAAQRSLEGRFSEEIHALGKAITELRVFVESAIDFPDEEIDFLAESDVASRVETALEQLETLLANARQGRLLRDGIVVAITGRPNAGKSSLLNVLAGSDVAIVTEVPGTTRDVLREQVEIDGIPLHVVDTAGIRETEDAIEREGIRRARAALADADIVLNIIDTSVDEETRETPSTDKQVDVYNKIDLLDASTRQSTEQALSAAPGASVMISAKTGEGLEKLKAVILEKVGAGGAQEGSFSARQRHIDALRRVGEHLSQGREQFVKHQAGELLAEELRLAQKALGEITGEVTADDLLGEIFASFCIGK